MTAPVDLEIWLTGTPKELDAAARALAGIGRVLYHGRRIPLVGADVGRYRIYARIRVHADQLYRPRRSTIASALTGLAA